MGKTYSLDQLTIKACEVLQRKKKPLDEVFATVDGNIFYKKSSAEKHAKAAKLGKVHHITKAAAKKVLSKHQAAEKERKAKIEEATKKPEQDQKAESTKK